MDSGIEGTHFLGRRGRRVAQAAQPRSPLLLMAACGTAGPTQVGGRYQHRADQPSRGRTQTSAATSDVARSVDRERRSIHLECRGKRWTNRGPGGRPGRTGRQLDAHKRQPVIARARCSPPSPGSPGVCAYDRPGTDSNRGRTPAIPVDAGRESGHGGWWLQT